MKNNYIVDSIYEFWAKMLAHHPHHRISNLFALALLRECLNGLRSKI